MLSLDPARYQRHALHAEERDWVEKNCYIDIWIEVLHAQGLEPLAMLPFTVAVDFEGDQWTFFKPPHGELWVLYGVDVQEMTVWRPLLEHVVLHTAAGRMVSTEADAFFLPDTRGTDYRAQHTKTTIIVVDVDVEQRRLGYFHNAGYFTLEGDDFAGLFRLNAPRDPAYMPLFAELIRTDRVRRLTPDQLRRHGAELLRRHTARIPTANPVEAFAARFAADLPRLQEEGLAVYHAYAFATVRQLGAAAELACLFLRWLNATDSTLAEAADAYARLSAGMKALILKGARAVNAKRPVDFAPLFQAASADWALATERLRAAAARPAAEERAP